MTTVLNITFQGQSADYNLELDWNASDQDVRRIAIELVRSGGARGLHISNLRQDAFNTFVVDRVRGPNGQHRIYLRPKVPFGAMCTAVAV